ncbi:hypothetical protein PMAYCL1PPCAC_02910 [Pristionchus mayeri]|uniref:Uncharacterized protein n=1 Tax=Pristionchus mayeri TaxID=1317129 RepID=A0AAN4Z922_9BILA|nr:hypothetical protein PMAYCL1PPCAC_02910 [Pristionchus mayeri]
MGQRLGASEFGERGSIRVETDVVLVVHHLHEESKGVGSQLLVEASSRLKKDSEVVILRDAEEVDDEEGDEDEGDLKESSDDNGTEVVENLEFLLTHSAE